MIAIKDMEMPKSCKNCHMCYWDKCQDDEKWKAISLLSELRSNYDCFDEKEEPYYHALSLAIKSIKKEIESEVEE